MGNIITDLKDPNSLPDYTKNVSVLQTHISIVFVADSLKMFSLSTFLSLPGTYICQNIKNEVCSDIHQIFGRIWSYDADVILSFSEESNCVEKIKEIEKINTAFSEFLSNAA